MNDLTPEEVQERAQNVADRGLPAKVAAYRIHRIREQRGYTSWKPSHARAFDMVYPGYLPADWLTGTDKGAPMDRRAAAYYAKCVDRQYADQ